MRGVNLNADNIVRGEVFGPVKSSWWAFFTGTQDQENGQVFAGTFYFTEDGQSSIKASSAHPYIMPPCQLIVTRPFVNNRPTFPPVIVILNGKEVLRLRDFQQDDASILPARLIYWQRTHWKCRISKVSHELRWESAFEESGHQDSPDPVGRQEGLFPKLCINDSPLERFTMARYLARSCPRCNGYVGITIRAPGRNMPVQAVNGRCSRCTDRMAWIVIRGKGAARDKIRNASRT